MDQEDVNQLIDKVAYLFGTEHSVMCAIATHKKTGKHYFVINPKEKIIECTNGREDKEYVLYSDGVRTYCREAEEFYSKFEM